MAQRRQQPLVEEQPGAATDQLLQQATGFRSHLQTVQLSVQHQTHHTRCMGHMLFAFVHCVYPLAKPWLRVQGE